VGPEIVYELEEPAQEIGTGLIDGASPDGSAIYVEQESKDFPEPACEGQPGPVISRLPLGGGQVEVLATKENPIRGLMLRGSGGRMAIVSGCEEFLTAVWTATETADGHLRDIRKLDLGDFSGSPFSFSWSADGTSILAANSLYEGHPPEIVRIDPRTGKTTVIFDTKLDYPVNQASQLSDGTFVVGARGSVTLRGADGAVRATLKGDGFQLSADRSRIALFGRELALVADGSNATTLIPADRSGTFTSAEFSPDGRAIGYVRGRDSNSQVGVVNIADRADSRAAGSGSFGRVHFTGDGRGLAFNKFGEPPGFTSRVLLIRFRER
jgi:Tol biopolymer transport system component